MLPEAEGDASQLGYQRLGDMAPPIATLPESVESIADLHGQARRIDGEELSLERPALVVEILPA